ncbi:adenosylcobalamin-dependent ribonucleoside-diphosphate reductase [Planctomycetota bacterium]
MTMNTSSHNQHRLSQELLKKRYLRRDPQGSIIETPDQMYGRVAKMVATVEKLYYGNEETVRYWDQVFYQLMVNGLFLPNSPTLMNAGLPKGMLSACFVLPVNDSIDDIFKTVKNTAVIQKAGGGTGFTFDKLRPTGDLVASTGGMTSGPISFWKAIAETTNAIQQGAHRRGANMGMMSVEHPDILKFIHAKQDVTSFTNFNISVKVTDRFMQILHTNPNTPLIVINPRTQREYVIPKEVDIHSYTIHDLEPAEQYQTTCYSINDLWQMTVANAHATGEPGICFIDRINDNNPTPHLGAIHATNPCGEQPLLEYEACNLGSLNVSKFVLPDESDFNWESLGEAVQHAVRFLDNVIDVSHWPIEEIQEKSLGNRKIGLGLMGFADALILLKIRYDSDDAITMAEKLGKFIQSTSHAASESLAQERGNFPNWPGSIWDTEHHVSMRNATCTTIAPTGSISIIAECSSGIEPIYSVVCKRRALDGSEFMQIHPLLRDLGTTQGWMTEHVRERLLSGKPTNKINDIPSSLSEVLVTAHQISPQWHVHMQNAFQSHIDNAVSKTVNLPVNATTQDVDAIFKLAYQQKSKGITVYRDSSRPNQILSKVNQLDSQTDAKIKPRARPRTTTGSTFKFRMGCGTLFVTVNRDDKGICEVFANLGKAGGCPSQTEATCRAVSAALRSGVDPHVMIDQLSRIRCLSTAVERKSNNDVDVLSCPDAIAKALKAIIDGNEHVEKDQRRTCPECGAMVRKESGCILCDYCGFVRCG